MSFKIKNDFEYKLAALIIYLILNLSGLSILFLFSPKNLLFKNSRDDKIMQKIFKDFAKNIYENINTPLIKNLTLSEEGEECPENFKPYVAKNQYYGNFTKFYGNRSICIERFNDSEYTFYNLLKIADHKLFNKNTKKCGTLIKNSNFLVNVSDDITCPLNHIEINNLGRAKNFGNNYYQIGGEDEYLIPIYGNNPENPIIINIEIINNYKVCLEKHVNVKELPCEFPDNNECFIEDNYEQIFNLGNNDEFKLYPSNLAKWNLANDHNIKHKFCNDKLRFHIFVKGYINFTHQNLKEFEEEFPFNDFTNNSLYRACNVYKSTKNIDNLFHILSLILFCLSLTQFILQIMLYLEIKGIRKIYLINGIVLFILKILSYFGMLLYHYYFYLKIERVHLELVDEPRNQILKYYSKKRYKFFIKIILIDLIGFLIILFDFIILVYTYIIQWGYFYKNYEEKEITVENAKEATNPNYNKNKNGKIDGKKFTNIPNPYCKKIITKNEKSFNLINDKPTNVSSNSHVLDHFDEITLKFISKDNMNKSYSIYADKDECFKNVVQKLKEKYPELNNNNIRIFHFGDNIINKDKTINDNKLKDNDTILFI